MKHRHLLAASAFALAVLAPAQPHAAERALVSRDGIQALVQDGNWCGPEVHVTLESQDPESDYLGERHELQRFLGGVRAVMGFECPDVERLHVTGRGASGNAELISFVLSKDDNWILRDPSVSADLTPADQTHSSSASVEWTNPGSGEVSSQPEQTASNGTASAAVAEEPAPAGAGGESADHAEASVQDEAIPADEPPEETLARIQAQESTGFDWMTLYRMWLTKNPQYKADPDFAVHTKLQLPNGCSSFRANRDEFSAPRWRAEAEKVFDGWEDSEVLPIMIRTEGNLRKYDLETGAFEFPFPENIRFVTDASGCLGEPKRPSDFPSSFALTVSNSHAISGLSMPQAEAEALTGQLTHRSVGVNFLVYLIPDSLEAAGSEVELRGRIKSYWLDNDPYRGKPETIYVANENVVKEKEIAASKRSIAQLRASIEAAEKHDAQQAVMLKLDDISTWFDSIKAGTPIDDSRLFKLSRTSVAKGDGENSAIRADLFGSWRANTGQVIHYVNADDFADRPFSEAHTESDLEALLAPFSHQATLLVRPAGAAHRPNREGNILYLYIQQMTVETLKYDHDTYGSHSAVFTATTPFEPLGFVEATQTARDYEIIGISGGQPRAEVEAILKDRYGEIEWYDNTFNAGDCMEIGHVRTVDRGQPDMEARCAKGRFVADDEGELRLAEFSYSQLILEENKSKAVDSLIERYGEPEATDSDGGYGGFISASQTLSWGKRLEEKGTFSKVHPLNAELVSAKGMIRFGDIAKGIYVLTMELSDELLVTERERSLKEAEEVKDSFELDF